MLVVLGGSNGKIVVYGLAARMSIFFHLINRKLGHGVPAQ